METTSISDGLISGLRMKKCRNGCLNMTVASECEISDSGYVCRGRSFVGRINLSRPSFSDEKPKGGVPSTSMLAMTAFLRNFPADTLFHKAINYGTY